MKYFLGVTNRDKWLKLKPGQNAFWCVYGTNKPSDGDLLFLYRTNKGICQVYRILSEAYRSDEIDCSIRGMLAVDIKLTVNLENPLTVHDFRSNPILAKSGPLGRNFQSTVFELSEEQGRELMSIIKIKNLSI